MKKLQNFRCMYAVNGFLALLCLGCSYAWSVFIVPMEQELHWVRSETSLAFTLNVIFYAGGSLLAGILAKKISYPALMRIAAVLVGAASAFATTAWCPLCRDGSPDRRALSAASS